MLALYMYVRFIPLFQSILMFEGLVIGWIQGAIHRTSQKASDHRSNLLWSLCVLIRGTESRYEDS